MFIQNLLFVLICVGCYVTVSSGFSVLPPVNNNMRVSPSSPSSSTLSSPSISSSPLPITFVSSTTKLFMAGEERDRSTKKGLTTIVKERTETETKDDKKKEEMWRVVLHNDEVHTFNYVIRSLSKCIGTLDRKASFEICVETHGVGKATVTKTWKKQAEQFCLGLQRQGLTVSISPDEDFEGGHSGGNI